jgi:small subunit ribosomal protein S4
MIIGPKYKICKRLGASVFEKCQTAKYQLAEARAPRRTGRPGRGGGGDFGVQLSESQFARYVHEAMDKKGADSKSALMVRLESRLDNTVYRAGFVKTRRAARQLVSHGHVMVNGRRMTIPSYKVEIGDVVSIRPESRPSPLFVGRQEAAAEHKAPVWMTTGDEGFSVTVNATPSVGDVAPFNAATIIQFYSR